ncbi:MAG: SpoVR family protein, partial [Methylosarcina sp.]
WNKTLHFAMQNFKDESFIGQYLSPKVIRDFKLFSIFDDYERSEIEVTSIHNDSGYQYVRHVLSEQYNLGSNEPNIQIYDVDLKGDRTLTLRHTQYHRMPLDKSINEVLKHVVRLWGFDVYLETVNESNSIVQIYECKH